MSLYTLPNEVLLIISNYLDIYSLTQLKCVCNKFNLFMSDLLPEKSNDLLVTNQMSEKFRERCKPLLSSYNSKFITHYNWINGIYKESKIYEGNYISPSGLEMTQNRLWFFYDKSLYAYDRAEDGTVKKNEEDRAVKYCDSSIYSIACCNDVIISSHSDGSIRYWRIESRDNKNYFQLLMEHFEVHDSPIITIDATSEYIVSSSKKGLIKIHKNLYEDDISDKEHTIIDYYNFVITIAFDPTGTKLAAGGYHSREDRTHLSIYDINKSHLNEIDVSDDICLQLLWEDPHTILICYGKYIKKMDMRTSKFVRTWKAPFNTFNLSCMSTDYKYTIMTGTESNHAILWDQRKSVPIQVYNISNNSSDFHENLEVVSVPFDSRHLYIASSSIYEFDFKEDNFGRAKLKAIY